MAIFKALIARSRFIRLLTDHPITPRMQIQDHGKIQPTFTRPDLADVTGPFLVRLISCEVPAQQVRCDVELMITVRRDLVFAGSHYRYTVLTHPLPGSCLPANDERETPNTSMANVRTDLFQLFGHPWPAIAAQAETGLLFDVRQRHQIRSLSAAGRVAAEGRKPRELTPTTLHNRFAGKQSMCSSINPNLIALDPQRTGWLFRMSHSSLRMRTTRRSRSFF
jgi:hypothetical protein